jgi:transposase
MFLKKSKNHKGRIYLSLVQGYRDESGKSKQKTIEKIGYLDELEKKYDDPIAHFTEEAIRRTESEKIPELLINLSEKLPSNTNSRKNLGYAILQSIYRELGLPDFFKLKQRKIDASFNLNAIFKLLTYSRILNPASKKATFEAKESYFESFRFSLDDIYRSLSHFDRYKEEVQAHLHHQIKNKYGRDTDVAYYDCTNYYFEIHYNDEDRIEEETGEIIKETLRKKGPSKENKRSPIVQMGLLMDKLGIPMTYHLFPGNSSEKTSLLPILKRTKREFGLGKVIVVADRGLNTSDNIFYNQRELDGYVFSQTVRGADKEFKAYALEDAGFTECCDGSKYKARIHSKDIQIIRNSKRTCKTNVIQKQVIIYSPKYDKRAKLERERIIKKAEKLISNPSHYTKATSVGAAGYVKNIDYDKKTGEIIARELLLDLDKIREEEKYDGYYAIVTSELEKTPEEIREIYRGLWKIEQSFRITKSEFDARPVYLSLDEHIEAHFFVCFVSLVILRILEMKLENKFSTARIINSLQNYSCSHIKENYYLFDYRDNIIEEIERVFDVDFSLKVLTRKKIKEILSRA